MHKILVALSFALLSGCVQQPAPYPGTPLRVTNGYAPAYPPVDEVMHPRPIPIQMSGNLVAQDGALTLRQGDVAVCK